MPHTVPSFNLGYIPEDDDLLEMMESTLPQAAWDVLEKRDSEFSGLLHRVLSGEIRAEAPAFRVASCDAGAGNHPGVWMDWSTIRSAVSASITQIEADVNKHVKAGRSLTLRDLFPLPSFYLLVHSSFDEPTAAITKRYRGDALAKQFEIWKGGINKLMESVEAWDYSSLEGWVLDQVAILDWNSALVDGPFSKLPPPLAPGYNDAVWRKKDGKTRASLVVTPAGHLSYAHADDNLAGFEILTINGYKIWFIWDSTPENIKIQQARMDKGLNLRDFKWCLDQLGMPRAYITGPGTVFVGNPGYIHAVFSFTPSAHWAFPIVSREMVPRRIELLPIWEQWIQNHKKYLGSNAAEKKKEDDDLGQAVRDLSECTETCLEMWEDWEKEQASLRSEFAE